MDFEHKVVSVDRNHIFWLCEFYHLGEFVLLCVASGVDVHCRVVIDLARSLVEGVFEALNRVFIPRDDGRREYYRVFWLDSDEAMLIICNPHQSRAVLALRAGAEDRNFTLLVAMDVFCVDDRSLSYLEISEFLCDCDILLY